MTAISEAAERLRQLKGNTSYIPVVYKGFQFPHEAYMRDLALLAHAYLVEHRADEDEPITEEWLCLSGFASSSRNIEQFVENEWFAGEHRIEIHPEDGEYLGAELRIMIHSADVWVAEMRDRSHGWTESIGVSRDLKTRGDVRRLCKALGIELKSA